MNRPTLLVIQTLVMMGPHLTNGGKFLDASALFGGTVRLAQSIGCTAKIPLEKWLSHADCVLSTSRSWLT